MAFFLSAAFCLCALRRTDWLLLLLHTSFALPLAKGANSVIDPATSVQGFAAFLLEVSPLGAAANLRRQMLIPFSLWSPPISPQPGATGTRDEACRRPSRPPLIVSSVLVGSAVLLLGTAVPSLFQRCPFKRVELGWNDPLRWKHGGLAGWGVCGGKPPLVWCRAEFDGRSLGRCYWQGANPSQLLPKGWVDLVCAAVVVPNPGRRVRRSRAKCAKSHNFAFRTHVLASLAFGTFASLESATVARRIMPCAVSSGSREFDPADR
jgi:hypothetical protein